MRVVVSAMLGLGLVGCAAAFQPLPPGYDFGAAPVVNEDVARLAFKNFLKDPDSARFEIGVPQKAHCNAGLVQGAKLQIAGWAFPVSVNARNSYGGYVGYQPYILIVDKTANFTVEEAGEFQTAVNVGRCSYD